MPAAPKKRVLIVDDHPIMRDGFRTLLSREPDLSVCAEAENASEALSAAAKFKPHLALVDVTLPGRNGVELIKDLRAIAPALPILVVSLHDEALWTERALRAGARGYVMKREPGATIMRAVRRVLEGEIYVSEKMSAQLLKMVAGQPTHSAMGQLSDREFEVFQLISGGRSTAEIADELHLSAKTIDAHRANIKTKLGLKTTPELIAYAARWVESGGTR